MIVRGDTKPSQRSGVLYKIWVAILNSGAILSGHCTCMAGISEVCNHVGALLYKCMQQKTDMSSTSAPNKWLPARKNVNPVEASDLVFKTPKLDECNSKIVGAKETVRSAKTSSVLLREPTEENQEEFFFKTTAVLRKSVVPSTLCSSSAPTPSTLSAP